MDGEGRWQRMKLYTHNDPAALYRADKAAKGGPYQDQPLLYPFHRFLSLLWPCFSPGSV